MHNQTEKNKMNNPTQRNEESKLKNWEPSAKLPKKEEASINKWESS